MIAYIICCNDSIKAVVVDDGKRAEIEMEKRKKDMYEKQYKWTDSFNEYGSRLYWHIHEQEVLTAY